MADYCTLTESYYCLQVGLGVIEYIVIAARDRFIPYLQDGSDRQVVGDTLWWLITMGIFLILVSFTALVRCTGHGPARPYVLGNVLVIGLHLGITLVFFLQRVGGPLVRGALVGGLLIGSVGIISGSDWGVLLENELRGAVLLGVLGVYLGLRLWAWWQTLADVPGQRHEPQAGESD